MNFKSSITVFVELIAALSIVVGGIFWLASINSQTMANAAHIGEIKSDISTLIKVSELKDEKLVEIRERLVRIETKMDKK